MKKNLTVKAPNNFAVNKLEIHRLVSAVAKELVLTIDSLEINFINAKFMREINNQLLKHDHSTDIITLNYSENLHIIDAEIYVSLHDAFQNSQKWEVSLENEVTRLIIHGILHLCGFDDLTKNEKMKMKKKEDELVAKFKHIIKKKILLNDC